MWPLAKAGLEKSQIGMVALREANNDWGRLSVARPYVRLQVVDARGSGKAVHSAAFNLNIQQALEAYNKAVALVAVGSSRVAAEEAVAH